MPAHARMFVLVVLVISVMLPVTPAALSVPEEQALERQIEDAAAAQEELEGDLGSAEAELAELEAEFQLIVDDYNAVNAELTVLESDIADAEADVDRYRDATAYARDQMGRTARTLYMSGLEGGLAGLLVGASSSDVLRRLKLMDAVRTSRLEAAEQYAAQVERYSASVAILEAAYEEADAKKAELADLRTEIEARVESQRDDIARLQGEVERQAQLRAERQERLVALRAERARREAAARAERQAAQRARTQSARTQSADQSADQQSPAAPAAQRAESPARQEQPAPAPAAASGKAAIAVRTALAQVGKPYQWGGSGPSSFDCSGLTSYAWRAAGVSLPHNSTMQYNATARVSRDALRPGDLLFFYSPISHVGMYIGDGKMVDAPYSGQTVRVRSIFRGNFVGAGRPRY